MLYKIEFLTIENIHLKKDYEVYNSSRWESAFNRFVSHQKFYFPVWILNVYVFDQDLAQEYPDSHGWLRVDNCDINQLNIDLGFCDFYNDCEDFSSNS